MSPGEDPAGISHLIERAFARHAPGWSVRAMRAKENYLAYPADQTWDVAVARELYRWADVVHHHNALDLYPLLDRRQRKATVLHHHGSRLRRDAGELATAVRVIGAVELVSTLDLLDFSPNATWLPAPIEVDDFASFRVRSTGGPVRIIHAPTDRSKKGTEAIIEAVASLRASRDVVLDLVEGTSWHECLERKGRADILVDQFELGYGHNALEAWAMGLPVVAGVSAPAHRERMRNHWGALPFAEATPATLANVLRRLVDDEGERADWAQRGLAHVARWHDPAVVVQLLQRVYATTPKSTGQLPPSLVPRGTGPRRRVLRLLRATRRRIRPRTAA